MDALNAISNKQNTAKSPDPAPHHNHSLDNKVEALEKSLEDVKNLLKDLKSGVSKRR